jgi:hypothetical protein
MQGEEQAIALATDLCARLERPVLLRLAQLLSQSHVSLESKKLHSAIDPQSIRDPKMEDAQQRSLELKSSSPPTSYFVDICWQESRRCWPKCWTLASRTFVGRSR